MTNEERIGRFKNEKIAIHCETEEEAKSFIEWCCANVFEWNYTKSRETNYDTYKNEICYGFGFDSGEYLGYSPKCFWKAKGYEVIKYKDFMKEEKKMTKLEYIASEGIVKNSTRLCNIAHACKYGYRCNDKKYGYRCKDKKCSECEFNKNVNLCVQTLLEEHKEPIKLKQWEYDLLKAGIETYGRHHFSWHKDLCNMKNKGYFKDVDTSMTIQEILDNCEVTK